MYVRDLLAVSNHGLVFLLACRILCSMSLQILFLHSHSRTGVVVEYLTDTSDGATKERDANEDPGVVELGNVVIAGRIRDSKRKLCKGNGRVVAGATLIG